MRMYWSCQLTGGGTLTAESRLIFGEPFWRLAWGRFVFLRRLFQCVHDLVFLEGFQVD